MNTFILTVMVIGFAVWSAWAIRADQADKAAEKTYTHKVFPQPAWPNDAGYRKHTKSQRPELCTPCVKIYGLEAVMAEHEARIADAAEDEWLGTR